MTYSTAPLIIFCIAYWFISLSFSLTDQTFDNARELSLLVGYIFLFHTFLATASNNKIFYTFYNIGKIMSVIVITIAIFFWFFNSLANIIILYLSDENSTIMFRSSRGFLSFSIISVFYRTSPMITLLLPFAFAMFLTTRKKIYLLDTFIFATNLFFSGTRANILSACLIIAGVFLFYLYFVKKNTFAFASFFLLLSAAAGGVILAMLLQKGEGSLEAKNLHLHSTLDLLFSNPIRTFFVGYGPGSYFWTNARGGMYTALTELSYLEIIRNFGLMGACGILSLFLYPLLTMVNSRKLSSFFKFSLSIGYLAYLFIAGTNPFLNCATGYLTLSLFLYMGKNNIIAEVKK